MDEVNNCHVCTTNQKCVQLRSNSSHCVKGRYSAIKFFEEMFYIYRHFVNINCQPSLLIYVCFACVVKGIYDKIACFYFLDDADMNDCGAYHSLSPFSPSGLYRIKLPVVGHVTALCEMDIDGGGWTVSVPLRKCFRCFALCLMKWFFNTKKSNAMALF